MSRKNNKQLTAAEIAAQAQAMEEAEIQRAFEQGITTLRDLSKFIPIIFVSAPNMVVHYIYMVIHAP